MKGSTRVTFGATLRLPAGKAVEDELDLVVVADVLPGDKGGLHFPASGPIPEIIEVRVDPHADVRGTRYERGEDVLDLLGANDMFDLEDLAVYTYIEEGKGEDEREPTEDDAYRSYEEET